MINLMSRLTGLACISFFLASCGSGSSSNVADNNTPDPDDTPVALTGVFVDGPVENLRFETTTQSGFTNANGEFLYLEGETVSFYVGDILIGDAMSAPTLSPFDLVGIEPPVTAPEVYRQSRNLARDSPFATVVNISVFLQTLDADTDLSNNIQIPDELHDLASGVMLEFEQPADDFMVDFALRQLLTAGRDEGLWGGTKVIRNPGSALDTLYANLGLTPEIYLIDTWEVDVDNDGAINNSTTYTYANTDAGNQYVVETDSDNNGTVDSRWAVTFDDNGNLTLSEEDYNGDGVVDDRNTYGYDDNGNQILWEEDSNGDGVPNQVRSYGYDAYGSQISWEVDSNGDGTLNYARSYEYDDRGNMIQQETDSGADGTVSQRITYTYDDNNNLVLEEWDQEPDGVVDITYTYTRDDNGNLTLLERDKDGDGIADFIRTYAYDANGNETLTELDTDGDGTVDRRTTYAYDDNGYQTLSEIDRNADGVVDITNTYAYDELGHLILRERDVDGSGLVAGESGGVADVTISYTRDDNGNLILWEEDIGSDGVVDLTRHITYVMASWYSFWQWYFVDLYPQYEGV